MPCTRATIKRKAVAISAAGFLLALPGCQTVRLLTDQCDTEIIRVSWPVMITRGGQTNGFSLTGAVTESNIDPNQFRALRNVLVSGGGDVTNVVWTVNAFNINGGYIAMMHPAPLTTGQVEPVNLAWDGGGWGTITSPRPFAPTIAVRADNFTATSASGSMRVISGLPLTLAVDVTTSNGTGETMRIVGEAVFTYERLSTSCS